jgi:putative oxidoreductase
MDKRDWATFILRVVLGTIFMLHGAQKLFGVFGGAGPTGLGAYFTKIGINPGLFWAWVVAIVEFFGGSFLIFGFLTRFVAAALVIDMTVAVFKVHFPVFFWSRFPPGGFEMPMTLGVIALSLLISGSGGCSVDRAIGLEKRRD